jgi:tetratricopeptide (TPR) repeat protein
MQSGLDQGNPSARAAAGGSAGHAGTPALNAARAAELLARAQRLEAFAARDPGNADLLRDLADTYHQAGDHERALQALDRAGRGAPDAPLRGRLLLALGRWDDAARLFDEALQREPASAALWFNLGYALWAAGEAPQRAVQCLARAAELSPQDPQVLRHLALAQEAAGDPAAAVATVSAAERHGAADAALLVLLSQLQLDAGDAPAAQAAAARAVSLDARSPAAWQARGQAALFALDAPAAAQSLRQSLDLHDDPDTRVLLAQAQLMQGRAHQARRLLEPLLAHHAATGAGDPVALCMAGWACCGDDDPAAAARAFEAALALDAQHADALAGLALVRLALGAQQAARELVDRALAAEPEHLAARLVTTQLDNVAAGSADARAVVAAVLRSTPFGPVFGPVSGPSQASVAQALEHPALRSAAQRMQRGWDRRARQVRKVNSP